MSVIVEFTVEPSDFPLGSIFNEHPDTTVELERLVPTERVPIPYFWVEGIPREHIASVFEKHIDIESIKILDEVDGDYLFRVDWSIGGHGILRAFTNSHVSLISATGSSDGWTFEVRAESGNAIREFRKLCQEDGVSVVMQHYHRLVSRDTNVDNLTAPQREALLLAYERGYYRSPRQTTLKEMASELEITGQSLGSRLQRGIHRLIGSTLVE